MKKSTFYSLVRENGKTIAKQWDGWTDGNYNYYKNKWGTWSAIHPETGLAVCSDNTRKITAERANAPGMVENVKRALQQRGEALRAEFERLTAEREKVSA